MATLTAQQKIDARGLALREYNWGAFGKPGLDAAIAAIDGWIAANQASLNAALPLPFRTQATLAEKTLLFCRIAMQRAGKVN